jgi:uncharacterized protein (DUF2147 family)
MLIAAVVSLIAAGAASPEGLWKTVDDRRRTTRSLVRIWRDGDQLRGKVETVFDQPGEAPRPMCTLCPGEKKDQPVVGLEILWGFHGPGPVWAGGRVLDPEEGKTYKGRLRMSEDGKTLVLRGYVGIPLLGRSQTWVRVE